MLQDERTPEDRAWSAGFLDGEGAFSLRPRRPIGGGQLHVGAKQVVDGPLLKLRALWGGTVRGPIPSRRPNRRPIFSWSITGPGAVEVIRAVRPYLTVKAGVADVVLGFAALTHGKGYRTDAYDKAERLAAIDAARELNLRGARA